MEITGEFRIPLERDRVWQALNDPDILKSAIPGCESMEREAADRFSARLLTRIGPVKAKFSAVLTLSNINPPVSYTITGEGKGGPAGFGRGGADVSLEADGDETVLRYVARMQVGGKLAQVGSRLVEGAARKIADDFFSRFVTALAGT